MIQEMIHFLLMVLASVCGILIGARLAVAWEDFSLKMRCRRMKKQRK